MKTEILDTNVAATVVVQGKPTEIRRYTIGGVVEYRFPYHQDGKRRFKCSRTLEDALAAAETLGRTMSSPAVQAAAPATPIPGNENVFLVVVLDLRSC